MNTHSLLHKKLPYGISIIALILLVLSMAGNIRREYTDNSAEMVGKRIEKRLDILDRYVPRPKNHVSWKTFRKTWSYTGM